MPQRDAYEVLQVTRQAHQSVIKAAYRALATVYHPDNDPSAGAVRRMAEINDAYAKLRTSDRRELYDRSIDLAAKRQPTVSPATGMPAWQVARRPDVAATGSVLDFGRYIGWRLNELAQHDPDYLLWLARHSSGLRYRREIEGLLRAPGRTPVGAGRN